MSIVLFVKGRKSVPIGTKVALPGGKYYREKTATGWKHVKVERKGKQEVEEDKKKKKEEDKSELTQNLLDAAYKLGLESKELEKKSDPTLDKRLQSLIEGLSTEDKVKIYDQWIKGWNGVKKEKPEKKGLSKEEIELPKKSLSTDEAKVKVGSGLIAGAEVEVQGMKKKAMIVTKHRDGTATIKYGKNEKTKRIKLTKLTAVVALTDDKKVQKVMENANESNRTSVDAQINGGEIGKEVKPEVYDFKPTEVSVQGIDGISYTMDDYSNAVPNEINLVSEKNILNKPKPSYIPDMDPYVFSSGGYRVVAAKLPDGNYVLRTYAHRMIPKETQEKLVKVSLEVLAATQDYYSKKVKAEYKMKLDESEQFVIDEYDKAKKIVEESGKLTQEQLVRRGIESQVRRAKYLVELINEDKSYIKKYAKRRISTLKRRLADNRMTSAEMNLIAMFSINDEVSNKYTHSYNARWAMHNMLMKDLFFKSNDMHLQYEDNTNVYHKGENTSYGDKGTKNTLLQSHGVKVKRQNGAEITNEETNQIKNALTSVYSIFGNRSSMSKAYGLKISHAGEKNMHARRAIGIFFPHYHAIGVSFSNNEQGGLTLSHEFAHFMDNYIGKNNKRWFASDDWNSTSGKIATRLRSKLKTKSIYATRTCECFARSMESYFAYKTGGIDLATKLHADYGVEYYPADMKFMQEAIYPLCDQFLKENNEVLKSMQTKLIIMSKGLGQKLEKAVDTNAMQHKHELGAGAKKRKKIKSRKNKFDTVMAEFARGTLHSSDGEIVTSKEQALAIAYSESGIK